MDLKHIAEEAGLGEFDAKWLFGSPIYSLMSARQKKVDLIRRIMAEIEDLEATKHGVESEAAYEEKADAKLKYIEDREDEIAALDTALNLAKKDYENLTGAPFKQTVKSAPTGNVKKRLAAKKAAYAKK